MEVGYREYILSLACFLLFLLLRRPKRVNGLPRSYPLLGMLPGLISQLHRFYDWITGLLTELRGTFLFKGPWFSGMEILATADPANIKYVCSDNFANYVKGRDFSEIFDILGDGIFVADSDSWKNQRKLLHSLIGEPRFRKFVARTSRDKVQSGLVPLLTRAAEQRTVVDLHDLCLRFTFDTICIQVFGLDPGCLSLDLPSVAFANAVDDAEEVIFFRHIVPPAYWKLLRKLRIGQEKKMAAAWETIDDYIYKRVSAMKEELTKIQPEELSPDLLTSISSLQRDNSVFSDSYLRDMALNLLVAGRDTTGTALAWFFWAISQHPQAEQKIVDELESIARERPEPVIFFSDDLSSAVYLQAALQESLRLYPPVPMNHKAGLKPDVLPSGHEVDPKKKIIFFVFSMARMESIWGEDCREFKPERWISDEGKLKREPSHKFLSFGSGPRICLGKDMAIAQMKVLAATLLYNFKITVARGHVVAPGLSIILHMKQGLKVTVEKRL